MRGLLTAAVMAAVATGLIGSPAAAAPADGDIVGAHEAGAIRDRYIVALKPSVSAADIAATAAALADRYDGDVALRFSRTLRGFTVHMTEQRAKRLAGNPAVDYVQQDKVVSLAGTQADPPWGLDRVDQAARPLSGTYTYPTVASNVHAYVLDTGIRMTHSQFGGRATSGFDFIDNDADATDCQGHGTHVAGTIGGATYGVAKGVTLVGVRVLDCQGAGSYSAIIAGIEWVTVHAIKPAVANLSLGGEANLAFDRAVQASIASGISYAVAAGNSAENACQISPARVPQALTVGATDSRDARAGFSNYGTCVDIFGPGVNVLSAGVGSDSATAMMSGTSMASPHVVGAAALYLATRPLATPAQVADALVAGAGAGMVTDPGTGSPNRLLRLVAPVVAAPAPPVVKPNTTPAPSPTPTKPTTPAPVPGLCNVKTNGTNMSVPDLGRILSPVTVSGCAGRASTASRIEVHIVHARRGDLLVELITPNGAVKRLKSISTTDRAPNVNATYAANLSSWTRNGTWTLRVRDSYAGTTGYVDSWTITV